MALENQQVIVKSSFPVLGTLGIIFVVLKVFGVSAVATWSWVWVLSPFWIPFAFFLVLCFIAFLLALLAAIFG